MRAQRVTATYAKPAFKPGTSTRQATNDNQPTKSGRVVRINRQTAGSARNPNYTTTDEQFADTYKQAGITNQSNNPSKINRVERQYQPANDNVQRSSVPLVRRGKRKKVLHKKTAAYKAGVLWARVRLSAVNTWVISWAVFWYLTFQLPLAFLSTAALGMAYAVYNSIKVLPGGEYALVVVEKVVEISTTILGDAIRYFADQIFGINFNPILIFIAPFAIIFLLGLFQLILTWFIYSAAGIKSLSGQRGGIKSLMFVFVGIGYALPILNLFPLIFLWMLVVWKYPK
jgi:hypothetical protein